MKVKKGGLNYEIQLKRKKKDKRQEKIDRFVPEIVEFANKIKRRRFDRWDIKTITHCLLNALGFDMYDEILYYEVAKVDSLRQYLYNRVMMDLMSGKHNVTLPDELLDMIAKKESQHK